MPWLPESCYLAFPLCGRETKSATDGGCDDPIRQLAAAFQRFLLSPPSPPVSVTLAETLSPEERAAQYVTLADAAAIKGRTPTFLKRAIRDGRLKAEKDQGWRIRRKDLEQLLMSS